MANESFDVVVLGAGPAGSTAAALIAQQGLSVALLERDEIRPRFGLGESLMPGTYDTLERLGVLDELKRSRHPRKRSVQFFSRSGRSSAPFYFAERDDNYDPRDKSSMHDCHERFGTWQVIRHEFDEMLIENAAARGAEVRRGVGVREVLFDDSQARATGVRARGSGSRDGEESIIDAPVVIDATGQRSLLARQRGLRTPDEKLRKISLFTHYKGARRDEGIDEGGTLILRIAGNAWFWFIPLADDLASVGVVGDIDSELDTRPGRHEEVFEESLRKCEPLQSRLELAERVNPVRVVSNFSYRSTEIAGDGWILVGDAFAFLDPMYSSGVLLALKSAEWAADATCDAFEIGDFSAERLGVFREKLLTGMNRLRKLVYAFYDPAFTFGKFVQRNPDCKPDLVDILLGDVFDLGSDGSRLDSIFEPMAAMCELPKNDW